MVEFTTVTDYQQTFEICLTDIWEQICKEENFEDEDADITEWDEENLKEIAWDYVLKNPDKYKVGEGDYDNETILDQSLWEEYWTHLCTIINQHLIVLWKIKLSRI